MGGTAGRARVVLARTATVLVVTVALLLAGVAWYFAGQLTAAPTVRPFEPDNEVLATPDGAVVLDDEGWAAVDGAWGLQLPDGRHVVLTERQPAPAGAVQWGWTDLVAQPPPRSGEPVRVDEFVYVGTPEAVGLEFRQVAVEGPLGPLPSWWVPAVTDQSAGTVVFVHGRGGTPEEALRFLPALTTAGWDVLVQTYRGDAAAPAWPDGRVRFGTTEWEDVAAAVDHAAEQTEGPIVLFGASMGGSLVAQYLDATDEERIAGVVLDSPMLSLDALLDVQAGLNGIPGFVEPLLLPVVQLVADVRFGLGSDQLEQVADDGTFDVPVLLFHGAADDFVPVGPSREFAQVVPDVTHVPVDGAGHVRSWNVDRDRYEEALVAFLSEVGP